MKRAEGPGVGDTGGSATEHSETPETVDDGIAERLRVCELRCGRVRSRLERFEALRDAKVPRAVD